MPFKTDNTLMLNYNRHNLQPLKYFDKEISMGLTTLPREIQAYATL